MTRAALLALAIAAPAHAGDTADWSGTGGRIQAVTGQAHVAEVTCRNVLTQSLAVTEADISAGGITVRVTVQHANGDVPDTFTIAPAPGFTAAPSFLVLDEFSRGTVLIFEFVGS